MRAVQCKVFGPPEDLVIEEAADPAPGPGQILIAVKAAGVGFVDGLFVQGLYQIKPPLPFIPGSEIAGEVLAVGEGVTEFAAGDRVLGLGGGAFAEKAVAPAAACAQMPQNFSFEEAAGFLISYCTALYGLRDCGALETGETLLVLGAAGGVGMAAIDVAKIMGATVIAAASTAEKLESCRAQGADMTIDYTIEGWRNQVKELTAGHGVNMVYDPVGGEFSELAFRSLAPKGRHLVIGFAAGGIPRIPLNLPLLKRSSIVGVDWGGYMRDDPNNNKPLLEQLMIWAKDGKLHPVANARYALDDAAIAMRDLLDRKVMGKAIIIP